MLGLEYFSVVAAFASGSALGCLWPRFCIKKSQTDVLFFPDDKMPCNSFYRRLDGGDYHCQRKGCTFAHYEEGKRTSLMQIFMSLNDAIETIDLCVYEFTQRNLAEFLVSASKRGVKVRIITDAHADRREKNAQLTKMDHAGGSKGCCGGGGGGNRDKQQGLGDKIPKLQEAGIPIRVNKTRKESTALMHNKFVLIDGKCLMMGSFNWTQNAVMRNHEAIIRTNDKKIVKKFISKFNQMWKQSEDRPP